MAECHPVGFFWVMEAKKRGATIIHVDPRFMRTSAMADLHVPLRAGSDVAFLGGLVRYILENQRYFEEYVKHYTNAAALVDERFQDTEDLDGLFSGYDEEKRAYDRTSWQYQGSKERADTAPQAKATEFDDTLQHPRCVFQILKRHFSRYTPEMVADVCGVPPEAFERVAKAVCDNWGESAPPRSSTRSAGPSIR